MELSPCTANVWSYIYYRAFFNIDPNDLTDPFVTATLGAACIFKTRVINNDLNPKWDETFSVDVCHHANHLRLSVRDKENILLPFVWKYSQSLYLFSRNTTCFRLLLALDADKNELYFC